jgi:glycosyltransferase involved in cell wall biosynthesis
MRQSRKDIRPAGRPQAKAHAGALSPGRWPTLFAPSSFAKHLRRPGHNWRSAARCTIISAVTTNQPCVSIVIPAYNSAAYLAAAIESVRQQTYQDFEVLVVDDGSTDTTYEIAKDYAAKWPKLRAIHIEHAGLARARNLAIEETAGQWIALLDADDMWHPEKLRKCMDFLEHHPDLSVVYHPMAPIAPDGRRLRGRTKRCLQGRLTDALFHRIFIHDPTAVFHKRVIETCGGFDQSLPVSVGHEFWLRVSTKFEIGLVNETLAFRRCDEGSLTRRNRTRANRVKVEMLERFYFERGGREMINAPRAMRRLARVRFAAGRLLMAQKEYGDAADYFARAIRYCPTFIKSYPYYLIARTILLTREKLGR